MKYAFVRSALLCVLWLGGFAVATAASFDKRYERIESWDGTALGAVVMTPSGQGPGPFPLVVMPSSWSLSDLEYVGRAAHMAGEGYVVVSYTSRGFWDSQGRVDMAGPATVEDVSAVIDWALARTPASPEAIGLSGISLGAGTSLLAAARDPRIKAVAALSGWGDLGKSFYGNQTGSKQAMIVLSRLGEATGRAGPELAQFERRVGAGRYELAIRGMLPLFPARNPVEAVDAINRNGTAVMLGNSFNDSMFPPNQYVDFYNRLVVPKRLMFSQGDHATAELPGALGFPNRVYAEVERWFGHYLKGSDNGVQREPPVLLHSYEGQWLRYRNWAEVQQGATYYGLSSPAGKRQGTGALVEGATSEWSHDVTAGVPTLANAGPVLVTGLLQAWEKPVTISIAQIDRQGAAVWVGGRLPTKRWLTGSPRLRLVVTPMRREVSVFAYLYRVDAHGKGQLLTHKAYSLRNVVPGRATSIRLELEAAATELPAGDRLALVIDTLDPRYDDVSTPGDAVRFSSTTVQPAVLEVTLH